MKLVATRKAEQNTAAIDPWTAVHLTTGLALGLMDVQLRFALGLSVGYEAAEQWFERRDWGRRFFSTHGPESLPNAVVDTVALAIGHLLGSHWNRT